MLSQLYFAYLALQPLFDEHKRQPIRVACDFDTVWCYWSDADFRAVFPGAANQIGDRNIIHMKEAP